MGWLDGLSLGMKSSTLQMGRSDECVCVHNHFIAQSLIPSTHSLTHSPSPLPISLLPFPPFPPSLLPPQLQTKLVSFFLFISAREPLMKSFHLCCVSSSSPPSLPISLLPFPPLPPLPFLLPPSSPPSLLPPSSPQLPPSLLPSPPSLLPSPPLPPSLPPPLPSLPPSLPPSLLPSLPPPLRSLPPLFPSSLPSLVPSLCHVQVL